MKTAIALRHLSDLLAKDYPHVTPSVVAQGVTRTWSTYLADPDQPTRTGRHREYSPIDAVLIAMCIDTIKAPWARPQLATQIRVARYEEPDPWGRPPLLFATVDRLRVEYRPRWHLLEAALRAPPAT